MGATKGINQRQAWEPVAVVEAWAVDQAVWVYRTVPNLDAPITARILGGAVKALQLAEPFDRGRAEAVGVGAGLDDVAAEGEAVDDACAAHPGPPAASGRSPP